MELDNMARAKYLQPRIITFETDAPIGRLFTWDPKVTPFGDRIGHAQGVLTIPAGKGALLVVNKEDWTDISALSALGSDDLVKIDLSRSQVRDSDLRHLAGLTELEILDLRETKVDGSGFSYLERLYHLRWLNLSDCYDFADEGLAHISKLTGLRWLNLHETSITNEGVAHLGKLTSLETLNLSDTWIGDTGIAHLSNLPNLKELHLQGTYVSDEGLRYLYGLKSLRSLSLSIMTTTPAARDHLQKALRKCSIELHGHYRRDTALERHMDEAETANPQNCGLHGSVLKPDQVPVQYGLPRFEPEFMEAKLTLFPNSKSYVLGGCTPDAYRDWDEVMICQECRNAEAKWHQGRKFRLRDLFR